jgi:hypothetical protein
VFGTLFSCNKVPCTITGDQKNYRALSQDLAAARHLTQSAEAPLTVDLPRDGLTRMQHLKERLGMQAETP